MAEHTTMLLVEEQAQLFFWVKSSYIDIVGVSMLKGGRHVGRDDGPHVDEVDGHRVEVGVGVLPNREGRRCYSGL